MKAWGLDQPIPIQYCRWMGFCNPEVEGTVAGLLPPPAAFIGPTGWPNFLPTAISGASNGVLHGDFGYSTRLRREGQRPDRPSRRCRRSSSRASRSWSGSRSRSSSACTRRSTAIRCSTRARRSSAYVGFAMPTFWLGHHADLHLRGHGLHILPASGMTDTRASPPFGSDAYWAYFASNPLTAIGDIGKHLILPVITLVVVNIAGDSRFVRASMLETLSQDFVRTAKAKGLPARVVNFKHALRNALLPVDHEHRPRDPVPVHGRDRHRDDLLLAGHRQADDRRHPRVRLPDPDGRAPDRPRSSWCSRTSSPTSPTPSSTRASSTEVPTMAQNVEPLDRPHRSTPRSHRRPGREPGADYEVGLEVAQPVAARVAQVQASTAWP